ncbi:glycosyltransferase [Anaerococcus sp. AGMB00486]|uniref:Glycosyltransferase n=1 Tax=Anaerococcus faecalis TaxID=2742993 RepID=A0ABX2NA82_9FIRM|nr:glycosyltransferase [Anaerococcus faecalis]NVF11489.1 glycosyltransferase [Anaerococcus faecalis]
MRLEVLVSTMHQNSIDFYKKLNIKSDCIIINQTDKENYDEVIDKGHKIRMISTKTRGLGRSRNIGLLNSKADIILLCDDDEVFEDDYVEKVKSEFENYSDTHFFIMKTIIYQNGEEIIKVKDDSELKLYNSLKYGSVHFAFKREVIEKYNMSFSTYFGAGTNHGSGEDSLFLRDAFKNNLKVRSSNKLIAKVYNDESTWFTGYDEKHFFDKGMLSKALFPKAYRVYIEYYLKGHEKLMINIDKKTARKKMLEGAKYFGG